MRLEHLEGVVYPSKQTLVCALPQGSAHSVMSPVGLYKMDVTYCKMMSKELIPVDMRGQINRTLRLYLVVTLVARTPFLMLLVAR